MSLNYKCYQLWLDVKSGHAFRLNWFRLEFNLKQNDRSFGKQMTGVSKMQQVSERDGLKKKEFYRILVLSSIRGSEHP